MATASGGWLPTAPVNRSLVRPHACDMGGYAIAVGMDVASSAGMGSSQAFTYMVLRKNSDVPPPPQKF